jgi:hypothetical protein
MVKNYLINLFQNFLNFFRKKRIVPVLENHKEVRQQVNPDISPDEQLVRAIIHPFMISGGKLKESAVLPALGECDVSLIRHLYSTDTLCKQHGKSLSAESYRGLAVFRSPHVEQELLGSPLVKAEVLATPLDSMKNERTDWPVYIDDDGFPIHASLVYDVPPREKGVPNPPYVQFAKKFLKRLKYFPDPNPAAENWEGEEITYAE